VGIALCIFWRVRGDVRHASDVPVFGAAAMPAPSMPPPAVPVDHDPWDPQRFEPHGISDEDRWIKPRLIPTSTTSQAPDVAESTESTDVAESPESTDTPEPTAEFGPPSWSEDEPEPPDDPSR
jgi:hypothetical protein